MHTASVLHLVTSPVRRGAETYAVDLSEALLGLGIDSEVLALTDAHAPRGHDLPTLGTWRRSPGTLTRLRRLARRVDVVVAHGSSTLEACAVALAGASATPFVYRTIGDPSYWVRGRARQRAVGILQRQARRHVVLWEPAASMLSERYGIEPSRIDVISNAVASDRFPLASVFDRRGSREALRIPVDAPCLAFVGALSPEKGVATLLQALVTLPAVRLVAAGDGPQRQELQDLADRLAPGRVVFTGAVDDPFPIYAAADLVVLPSLSEGMPAAIIEAGLVGVPSIASSVGAVPEMIDDGRTGWMIEPGDASGLAQAVARALPVAGVVGKKTSVDFRKRYVIQRNAQLWVECLDRTLLNT